MRTIVIFIALYISLVTSAKVKTSTILEVSFERNGKFHFYQITKRLLKTPVYTLIFTNEKRQIKNRRLSQSQAELIKNEATRIIWENQYRIPASTKSCREYMRLKTDSEKTRICYENKVSTGQAFGFIHSLNTTVKE